MPGWQAFYEKHRENNVIVVAAAIDIQGAEAARPYIEAAGAEYVNLIDANNLLGELFGLRAVPNTLLIDEKGRFVGKASQQEAEAWAQTPVGAPIEKADPAPANSLKAVEALSRALPYDAALHTLRAELYEREGEAERALNAYERAVKLDAKDARRRFRYAKLLLQLNRKEEAAEQMKAALKLDPKNYIIRKQIWAVENPERFYNGGIDWGWQRRQTESGE